MSLFANFKHKSYGICEFDKDELGIDLALQYAMFHRYCVQTVFVFTMFFFLSSFSLASYSQLLQAGHSCKK